MSRIVKSWNASVDAHNRVSIENAVQIPNQPFENPLVDEEMAYDEPSATYHEPEEPPIDLEALRYEAELIIANAEKKANKLSDEIISTARNQAKTFEHDTREKLKVEAEQVREEAKQQGYEQAIKEAQLEADGIIQEANDIKQDAINEKEEMLANVEPEMVNLMIDILDHLIGVEKETNKKTITTLIKSGLARANPSGKITIHVSPEDYPAVDKNDLFQELDTMAELEVIEDPSVRKAGCIIETEIGTIDSSLDTQYKALRKNLKYILKNR